MKKEIIILLLTYFITSVIRGFIMAYTGFSFINIFYDNFEFIPFIIDLTIWTTVCIGVRLLVNKFSKKTAQMIVLIFA
ncbi:MAG TPA: hypothetical protein VFC60_01485 [Tissierellaceae bacterium]|nr:hypothetical protein [Tissierellaceae bacterium]